MGRNRLYTILSAACAAGYIWLWFTFYRISVNATDFGVCLFKRVTGIPCPSCGTTRSVLSILKGDFSGGLYWNPFGFIILMALIISPIWIVYDLLTRKESLYKFYLRSEHFIRRRGIAIAAIVLVLLNWMWNLTKNL